MKKLIHLLLGYAEVQVMGAFPERMLNLCARNRLAFWKLRRLDSTCFTFRVAVKDLALLERLAQQAMCEVRELRRYGSAAAARSLGRRWGFLLGLALCVLAVGVLSRFLLVVEVTGNETVSSAVPFRVSAPSRTSAVKASTRDSSSPERLRHTSSRKPTSSSRLILCRGENFSPGATGNTPA